MRTRQASFLRQLAPELELVLADAGGPARQARGALVLGHRFVGKMRQAAGAAAHDRPQVEHRVALDHGLGHGRRLDQPEPVVIGLGEGAGGALVHLVGGLVGFQELVQARRAGRVDGRLREVQVEHAVHVGAHGLGGVGQRVAAAGADHHLGLEAGRARLAEVQDGVVLVGAPVLRHPGAQAQVGRHPLRLDEFVARSGVQPFQHGQLDHAGGVAQQHRRHIDKQLIDAAGRDQRAAQAGAGLDVDFVARMRRNGPRRRRFRPESCISPERTTAS